MKKIKEFILERKKIVFIAVVLLTVIFILWKHFAPGQANLRYQTARATKGTLVVSVSESGQVLTSNRTSITTQASGIVSQVYVKNGDTVTQGEKIASIQLDKAGQQQESQAWASYLSAKNSLASAQSSMYSLQSTMFSKWKTYTDLAENSTYQNPDGSPNTANRTLPQFTTAQDDWLKAEADYQNQQSVINQGQSALNSAWLSYQKVSSDITAPIAGRIDDLTIAQGMQVAGSALTNASGSTGSSSQFVASIKSEGKPIIQVSISEVDAVKVKEGQSVTVTFDALPGKTFAGEVLGVNTNGQVSNGVTTYPATTQLDLPDDSILPNMSATANIITNVLNNAILVPSGAIQLSNGQSTVRIVKNGTITTVPVEVGESNDTDTQILSGVSAGDRVVVGIISGQTSTGTTSSPFGGGLHVGGFGAGGAVLRRKGG